MFVDKVTVFIQTYDEASEKTASEQRQSVKSLSGKGVTEISLLKASDARPAGCVAYPVSSSLAVFLHVKGRVDIDAEIAKASKKLDKTRGGIERQRKIIKDPAYQEKASAELQESDKKRLVDLESEAAGYEGTIKQFEDLKLE